MVGMAPPSKGKRVQVTLRPHEEVFLIIREKAAKAGVPYGDYMSAILSEYVGLSYLLPIPPDKEIHDLLTELGLPPKDEYPLPKSA